MSTIEELSAQLAGAGVNTAEWLQLMHAIVNDEDSDIRDAGMLTLQALQEKARGWLSQDDLILLLQGSAILPAFAPTTNRSPCRRICSPAASSV
jgi:hypothetical protein